MGRRYYILRDGERLYKDTLEAISNAAKREANRIGESIQVHYEEADAFGRSGRRGAAARHTPTPAGRLSYARNPDPSAYLDFAVPHMRAKADASRVQQERGARRKLKMFGGKADKPAATRAGGKFLVSAVSKRDRYDITAKSAAEAERLREDFEASGYNVTIAAKNPATRASKARKTAANKRGAYVEYLDGGVKRRIKYGNKGIATIRAAAMRRDGWRGVKVLMG